MMFCVARCRRAGFTLIEIMIVIAIIAILAGIAIPNIQQARAEASLAACRQNILGICKALDTALIRHSMANIMVKCGADASATELVDSSGGISEYLMENGCIAQWLKCPVLPSNLSPQDQYRITLWNGSSRYGTGYRVTCGTWYNTGGRSHTIGDERINPRYYMCDSKPTEPTASRPEGYRGCGWADYVRQSS